MGRAKKVKHITDNDKDAAKFAAMVTIIVAIINGIFNIIPPILNNPPSYLWVDQPPVIESFTSVPPDSHDPGVPITWTAVVKDPDTKKIYYKFQLSGPSTNHGWKTEQDYSQKNEWIWNANDSDIGTSQIRVLVVDDKHNSRDVGDDLNRTNYTIKDTPRHLYNVSMKFLIEKNYEEAIIAIENAIELRENWSAAWTLKGIILLDWGKNTEAKQALDWAIGLNPKDVAAWYARSEVLDRLGWDYDAARDRARARQLDLDADTVPSVNPNPPIEITDIIP